MDSNKDVPVKRASGRRSGERRAAHLPFSGEDRREGERRSGDDRRTADRA